MEPVLETKDLGVSIQNHRGEQEIPVVLGLSISLRPGEIHALVGESGSGKTLTALALMGLLGGNAIVHGRVDFGGLDLLKIDEKSWRSIRGSRISMIFQEPQKYLDPSVRIGRQISETLRLHRNLGRREAYERAAELLRMVDLPDIERVLAARPHELSGGMCQRVMIAQAIATVPRVLIADEPTTALDAERRGGIENLIRDLARSMGMAVLFISHDLRSVARIADQVSVMYAGRIVESSQAAEFTEPHHPYPLLLRQSIPGMELRGIDLQVINGPVPQPGRLPSGCAFHPRCPIAIEICRTQVPELRSAGIHSLAACHRLNEAAKLGGAWRQS